MGEVERDIAYWKRMLKFKENSETVYTDSKLNYSLTKLEMLRLLNPHVQLLTDAHMTATTQILRPIADKNGVLLLDSFFYPLCCTNKDTDYVAARLCRYSRKLETQRIVCFPVNLPGHWIVCLADLRTKTICVTDSLLDPDTVHSQPIYAEHWEVMTNVDRVLSLWMRLGYTGPVSDGPFFYSAMAHGRVQPGYLCGFYSIMYLLVQAHTPRIWKSMVSLDESHKCGLFLANLFTGEQYDWDEILFSDFVPDLLAVYRLPLRISFGTTGIRDRYHMYFTELDLDSKLSEAWPSYGPVPNYRPLDAHNPWQLPRETLQRCLQLSEEMKVRCATTGGYCTLNLIVDASRPESFAASRNFFCEMLRMCYAHVGDKRYDLGIRVILVDDYCAEHLRELFRYHGHWLSTLSRLRCSVGTSALLKETLDRLSNNACFYASCADSFQFQEWEICIISAPSDLHIPSCERKIICT